MTNRAKAIASLSGVFLIGALCGALVLGHVVRGRIQTAQRLRDKKGFQEFFVDRLKLTEAQRDSLRQELERTYDDLAELRRASAQQYGEVLDSFAHRIYPKLDSEQRRVFLREEQRLREVLPRDVMRTMGQPREQFGPPRHGAGGGPRGVPPSADSTGMMAPSDGLPRSADPRRGARLAPRDSAVADMPLAALSAPSSPAMAGDGPILQRLRDRLNLSDQQSAEIQKLFTLMRAKMEQDRIENMGMPRLQIWAFHRDLRDLDHGIVSVLRPDQVDSYIDLRKEIRDTIRARIAERMQQDRAR